MSNKNKKILITCCSIAIIVVLAIVIGLVIYKNQNKTDYYTVTFMVDNQVYYKTKTPLNETTDFPADPEKEGYAFVGWYDQDNNKVTEIKSQYAKDIVLTSKLEIDIDSTNFIFDTEDGYTITGLKDNTATELFIPDYVTAIGDQAFITNEYITNVTFAQNSNCKSIGLYAFQYCTALQSIQIPKSVEIIYDVAFYMCENLESVTFEQNSCLTTISSGVFSDCIKLSSIIIPASVTSIGDGAFTGCIALQNINFEKNSNLTTLGNYTFNLCSALKDILIPASVINLGDGLFMQCEALEYVTFEQGSVLEKIGDNTFTACQSLIQIHLPASVSNIGTSVQYTLKEICFEGEQTIIQNIEGLTTFLQHDTTIFYYSANEPITQGNYWHYVDDKITKW